eukprot:tig00001222_g7614.t1
MAAASAEACRACGSRNDVRQCGGCGCPICDQCTMPDDDDPICPECAERERVEASLGEGQASGGVGGLLHAGARDEAEDEALFSRELAALHTGALRAQHAPPAPLGPAGRPLSLYRLFRAVAARGGLDAALPDGPRLRRAARAVGRELGEAEWAGTEAGARALRAAWLRHLAPLERAGRGEEPEALLGWWRAEGLPAAAAAFDAARAAAAPQGGAKRGGAPERSGSAPKRQRPTAHVRADIELELRRRILLSLETDLEPEVEWALNALVLASYGARARAGPPRGADLGVGPAPAAPAERPGAHLLDALLRHMPAPPPRPRRGPLAGPGARAGPRLRRRRPRRRRPPLARPAPPRPPAPLTGRQLLNTTGRVAAARRERAAKIAAILRNLAYGAPENRQFMAHHSGTAACLALLLAGRYGPGPQRDALDAAAQLAPPSTSPRDPRAPRPRPRPRPRGGPRGGGGPGGGAGGGRRGAGPRGGRARALAACEALARLAAQPRHDERVLGEFPGPALDAAVALLHERQPEARDAALALLHALAGWGPATRAALAARRALVAADLRHAHALLVAACASPDPTLAAAAAELLLACEAA